MPAKFFIILRYTVSAEENDKSGKWEQDQNIEDFLEQRKKLDAQFEEKFTKVLTVMFTDLKGSTSMAETAGDLATRMILKAHNEIVFAAIKENNGTLVKTIGDGTLSHFPTAQDGVRGAAAIQKGIDAYNATSNSKVPLIVRIGLHTGKVIFEQSDIFGDVVNTASRFESTANGGEIYFSEETYNALDDKSEIYCRFIKMAALKGKKEPVKVYKAFWNPLEAEADKTKKPEEEVKDEGLPVAVKFVIAIVLVILVVFGGVQMRSFLNKQVNADERRSISQSSTPVQPPAPPR